MTITINSNLLLQFKVSTTRASGRHIRKFFQTFEYQTENGVVHSHTYQLLF